MKERDPLAAVWERADAAEPRFSGDEVASWPAGLERRLVGAGLIRRDDNAETVVCDACDDGHVAEVVSMVSPPGSKPRGYIWCPEAGRVAVPPERLMQWVVDFAGLAGAVATALDLAGIMEEVVPVRIWYLGKATIAGRSREVFFGRGLEWADASDTVSRCERLNASRGRLMFVPGAQPPERVWGDDRPPVVTLKTVANLGSDGRVTLDRDHLESVLTEGRRLTRIVPRKSFPTPTGARWRDIMLTVTDTHVIVEARRKSRRYSFAEAGFADDRKK